MRTALLAASAALALFVQPASLAAHHGGAAYDQSKTVTFDATVTEMQFANPHVLIFFDVKNSAGQVEKWSGWLTAPNKLARAGWTKRTLEPGDQIKVSGTPHKEGNPVLQIRGLVHEGKELPLFEE